MEVSCQCGSVSFETPTPEPLQLYHCHCLECRAQSASAYGTSAIFPAAPLFPLPDALRAKMKVYTRDADSGNVVDCYFCPECGVRLMHRIWDRAAGAERPTVSIKGGVVKGLKWPGGEHIFCRSAVVEIPEGARKWDAEPEDVQGRPEGDETEKK